MEPGHSTFSGPILWDQSFCPRTLRGLALDKKAQPFSEDAGFLGKVRRVPGKHPHPRLTPQFPPLYSPNANLPSPRHFQKTGFWKQSPPAQIHSCMNTVFIPGRVTLSSGLLTHLINCNDHFITLVRIPLFSNVP